MTFLTEHLTSRHLNFDLHRPMLDEENNIATFYLWNLSGQLVGYQQYNPYGTKNKNNDPKDGKYYTYRSKGSNSLVLFGVESLHLTPNVVFLTEGIFDAVRLTEKDCSALAVLSNNTGKDLINFLSFLNRKVVAICDNDVAGKKLAKFGDFVEVCESHDLGDSTDEYVERLIKKYA